MTIELNPSRNLAARPRAGSSFATTELSTGIQPVLPLLMRLLCAAALVLSTFGASAGVVLTTLHSFQGNPDGTTPQAGLVQGSDGYFYGTTSGGGTSNYGTVYKMSATGAYTSLYSFTNGNDGANPVAGLVQGRDGSFYGSSSQGGNTSLNNGSGYGTIFKITTNGTLLRLHSFTGTDGSYPSGALVQGKDGNFYGTTSQGGNTNLNNGLGYGTVFRISTNGGVIHLYSFTGNGDGGNPAAALVQGSDGNFYGTTEYGAETPIVLPSPGFLVGGGGNGGWGTVFRITSLGALTTLFAFDKGVFIQVGSEFGYPVFVDDPPCGGSP